MDNERVAGGAFLALILFGWFVWMLSKIVTTIFHDLGVMFAAIGAAGLSFLGMAWALAQLAAVLCAGAALVYAAYRHYRLVKEASSVLANVDALCETWANNIETSNKDLEKRVGEEVRFLRRQLAVALAKPEAVPELPKEPAVSAPPPPNQPIAVEIAPEQTNESDTMTPRVSNPY